jgi:phage-related protein (TIGR01555 family)
MSDEKIAISQRVDGLANAVSGKGEIGDQDAHTVPGRPTVFEWEVLRDLYRGTGIAAAVIDRPVDRSVRVGWSYVGADSKKIEETMKRIKFKKNLKKALKYEGVYGGALIVFGLYDKGKMSDPVSPGYEKGIDFMRVYHKGQLVREKLVLDPLSSRYGKPETYSVTASGYSAYTVHYSRCVELMGEPVDEEIETENEGWGDSRFVSTWDSISRYDDNLDTMKKIANNFVNISMEIDGLFNAIRAGEDLSIRKRIALFSSTLHAMNVAVHDKDEKIDKISSNVTGLDKIHEALKSDVCTSTGIPARILHGSQEGGLNNEGKGESDDWVDYIEDFFEEKIEPIIEESLLFITKKPVEIKINPVKTPTVK